MHAQDTPSTMIGRFPFGFYFDAETGDILDTFDIWVEYEGSRGESVTRRFFIRNPDGTRREVVRVDPWELL